MSEQHTVPSEPEPAEGTVGPAEPVVEETEEDEDSEEDEVDHSLDEIAKEVIAGEWGQGQEQRQKLADAGYDHIKVNEAVTRLRNNL
jgi:CW_7 repeat